MKVQLGVIIGVVSFSCLLLGGVGILKAEDSLALRLGEGKKKFNSICSRCHKVDKPLAKDMDQVQWDALLLDMAKKGAEMSEEDKASILEYLSAKSTFSTKCTVCHTKEQITDRKRQLLEWQLIVKKMAEKKPELMTSEEADLISAYLALTLGSLRPL